MTARASPARLAGFAALLALIAAAYWGDRDQVLLVAVAALPVSFLVTLAAPRGSAYGIAVTLLGVWWIGLALAHAVMLRALPHGGGIVTDVLVGTFVGDTGAYLGGRSFGRRRAGAVDLAEQDRRGARHRHGLRRRRRLVREPLPALAAEGRRAPARRSAWRSRRRSATSSRATSSAAPA